MVVGKSPRSHYRLEYGRGGGGGLDMAWKVVVEALQCRDLNGIQGKHHTVFVCLPAKAKEKTTFAC